MDREQLGREVRRIWIEWAKELPPAECQAHWLMEWEGISEGYREVDRRIGETLYALGQKENADYLAICRKRVMELEDTTEDFDEVLTATGNAREIAWKRVGDIINNHAIPVSVRVIDLETALCQYNEVLKATGLERETAWRRVLAPQTFRTTVITSPDMTEEQRVYWLAQPISAEETEAAE